MNKMYEAHPEILEMDRKRKRKTRRIVFIVIGVFVLFGCGLFFGIRAIMKSSDAYKTAVQYIGDNKEVVLEAGGIKDYGFPSGTISTTNGSGNAVLTIEVEGEKKSLDVYVELEKAPGSEWNVVTMEILQD
ncbi:cytochrome c oxidase assembly factor Coa1 family protein [Flavobacterium sp. DGU11]|uniref:Cytochrome c oxidase assembly factor Coa1 family protein n=1 Tax=Flavobacterium arundinis TaxID=3139143 RepID=A0ABU9HYT8_9FLAO